MELPDIRQDKGHDCGVAAPACVYEVLGIKKPRDSLRKLMGTNAINGTDPRTIEAQFRADGLKVLSGQMQIENLRHFTSIGCPVLCLVTLHGGGHYVVVGAVRYGKVHFQDPFVGPRSMRLKEFEDAWVDHDRFGVIYRQFAMAVWR